MTKKQKQLIVSVIILILTALGISINSRSEQIIEEVVDVVVESQQPAESSQGEYLVTRIVDGDTFEIESGQKVRLIGINTPEKSECYFDEASNKLSELVLDKKVRLEKDVSETDKYGRLLRYVYVGDVFVNEVLVREGFAQSTSYPPDVRFQDTFREAEVEARETDKGLWFSCQ